MNLKEYLFLIFTITLLALGSFLSILFNVDPLESSTFYKIGLFISLFLLVWGVLTFTGFYFRTALGNREIIFAHLPVSARQALLVSLFLVIVLAMQTMRVLTWWDMAILLAAAILIELFFHGNKKNKDNKSN